MLTAALFSYEPGVQRNASNLRSFSPSVLPVLSVPSPSQLWTLNPEPESLLCLKTRPTPRYPPFRSVL